MHAEIYTVRPELVEGPLSARASLMWQRVTCFDKLSTNGAC